MSTQMRVHPGLLHGYTDACTHRAVSVGGAFVWPLPQVTSEQWKTHTSQVTLFLPKTWAAARASLRGGYRGGNLWWPRLVGKGNP